jgi:hypothetical protein
MSVLQRAETAHASAQVLAGNLLTIESKRNSAGLGAGFRSVAQAAVCVWLLLLGESGCGSRREDTRLDQRNAQLRNSSKEVPL